MPSTPRCRRRDCCVRRNGRRQWGAPSPIFHEKRWRMTVEERLEKIEAMLAVLVERQTVREWYTTEQVAQLVGKAEFTVREWCRHGRLKAEKRISGRGGYQAWVVSHSEVLRYQREGLLPLRRPA